jgi:16S rRNA (cytosine967-C5)-methyltransferase
MSRVYASPPLSRTLSLCADAVGSVQAGRSLSDVLPQVAADLRPAVQALSFEVLRRLGGAQAVRSQLAPRTPPARVDHLLLSAIALLWPQPSPPYPAHTLVDQAVAAARERTPAAASFVNAVLRRFLREREARVAEAERDPVAAWNHPAWWITRLRQDWPAQWQALLAAAAERPPMVLRVNARRGSAADYVRRLEAQGLPAWELGDPALGGKAVVLAQPCPVQQLPGFADGDVSVQDASAQRAAPLLLGPASAPGVAPQPLRPGARVLDACAAPGGKTAHLLELADLDLLALDNDASRLARVRETLERLRLRATTVCADARQPATWWDGQPFDAILLDAPCSASGVVRRHPDARWLRRPEDVTHLARAQDALLQALWPLLASGGRLLYVTCSVFKAEGQDRIDAFLQRLPPGQAALDGASPGHLGPVTHNTALGPPGRPSTAGDGFYYALIHKLR